VLNMCVLTFAAAWCVCQVLRIVTLGSETGRGGFFPEGVNGKINSPAGFNDTANAWGGYTGNQVSRAASEQCVG
jgi:hypothetical protein